VKSESLTVPLGDFKVIKLDFAASPKIQNSNGANLGIDFIPSKREITLKGLKAGKSSVILRNQVGDIRRKYNITITSSNLAKTVVDIRQFLGDVEGIEIGIKGGRVYVGGFLVVPRDIGKVVTILNEFKDRNILRLVQLSPQTQRKIAQKMQEEIQKAGMRDVTVRIVNGVFWLEGVVTSNGRKQLASTIALGYLPDRFADLAEQTDSVDIVKRDPITNLISVNVQEKKQPLPKMIKIIAQFVELQKDYLKSFGFKWAPTLATGDGSIGFGRTTEGGVSTNSSNTLSGTIANLFPKLATAKSAGFARVVQSGMIVTKDRTRATIKKNQTTNFSLGTGDFTRGQQANTGFSLQVTPAILQAENVELNIGLGVSVQTGDPPQVLSNDLSTSLMVKSKETAVIGGVVIKESTTGYDKNPPGGVDEVDNGSSLFNFIRSKRFSNNKSQFVVFITPEIITKASEGSEEVKRKFRKRGR